MFVLFPHIALIIPNEIFLIKQLHPQNVINLVSTLPSHITLYIIFYITP